MISYQVPPKEISTACQLASLEDWLRNELREYSTSEKEVIEIVVAGREQFVHWPKRAVLLWPGAHRKANPGAKKKYFKYPLKLKDMARTARIPLDTRSNGPAVLAFFVGGGNRPPRLGSSHAWSVHHLYSGKFPDVSRADTIHAIKEGNHFTQSAGLVALHPIADALVDEYPPFAWYLRAESFRRFGYDPDGAFSDFKDEYGFTPKARYEVVTIEDEPDAYAEERLK